MILLLAMRHAAYVELHRPGLGRLLGPRLCDRADAAEWPWAADNDAYSDWDEHRFRLMLDAIAGVPGCLFVTAPDVVGDHEATLTQFWDWAAEIRLRGLPIAFVAQNGATPETVPDCDAVFLGGTDRFKLGSDGRAIAAEARRRGCWLHMGRVNSHRRMRYAHVLGCDSIDGTCFSRWRGTHLEDGQRWRAATVDQLLLDLGEA